MALLKKVGRQLYKATGYKNPMKKGKLSSSRVTKQLPKLMQDVARLKGIINSEKFRIETSASGIQIGQVNGNTSGHYIADFTPLPNQGDGYNNRQGQSIRWKSSHFSLFLTRQGSNQSACKVKIQLIKIIGEPYSNASNILGKFIEPNRWVTGATVYDTASDRKPEYFKQYRVLRTINVTMPAPQYAAAVANQQKIVNFGLRLPNHHVKWNLNSNTLADGQVICLVTMDTGNCSTTTASTALNVTNPAVGTGLVMAWNKVDYYYDN